MYIYPPLLKYHLVGVFKELVRSYFEVKNFHLSHDRGKKRATRMYKMIKDGSEELIHIKSALK
jgi:hypothetical protein